MSNRIYHVLFLCTGNSARSILAEALLNRLGSGNFRAFSAGSFPKGRVHPLAIELLQRLQYSVEELRSKSWDEFSGNDSPQFDFVITVCDNAAGEVCPVWPGHPMMAHWGIEDPAVESLDDTVTRRAFEKAFAEIEMRIQAFCGLPIHALDRAALKGELNAIGRLPGGTSA